MTDLQDVWVNLGGRVGNMGPSQPLRRVPICGGLGGVVLTTQDTSKILPYFPKRTAAFARQDPRRQHFHPGKIGPDSEKCFYVTADKRSNTDRYKTSKVTFLLLPSSSSPSIKFCSRAY